VQELYAGRSYVKGYGKQQLLGCRFAPKGSTGAETLIDSLGIASVSNTAAGTWTVTLSDKTALVGMLIFGTFVDNLALLHEVKVFSYDVSAGTFVLKHRTAANDAATPLADSDVVDEIHLFVVAVRSS
jgi:hypothetical protein